VSTGAVSSAEQGGEREGEREGGPVWAAMVCSNLWRSAHDDLHARIWCVILSSSLLAVHVTKGVGVLLLELIMLDKLCKLSFPEDESFLQFHTLERRR
jgi:hypothetical protein